MGFTDKLSSRQYYVSLSTAQAVSQALNKVRLSTTADLGAGLTATSNPGAGLTPTAVNDVSHDVHLPFGLLVTHP